MSVDTSDPKHSYALGIDVGTTSVKIAVVRLTEEEAAVQIAFHAEKNTDVSMRVVCSDLNINFNMEQRSAGYNDSNNIEPPSTGECAVRPFGARASSRGRRPGRRKDMRRPRRLRRPNPGEPGDQDQQDRHLWPGPSLARLWISCKFN